MLDYIPLTARGYVSDREMEACEVSQTARSVHRTRCIEWARGWRILDLRGQVLRRHQSIRLYSAIRPILLMAPSPLPYTLVDTFFASFKIILRSCQTHIPFTKHQRHREERVSSAKVRSDEALPPRRWLQRSQCRPGAQSPSSVPSSSARNLVASSYQCECERSATRRHQHAITHTSTNRKP